MFRSYMFNMESSKFFNAHNWRLGLKPVLNNQVTQMNFQIVKLFWMDDANIEKNAMFPEHVVLSPIGGGGLD